MKILILGTGKGSFTVRGHQLGAAIGARVSSHLNVDSVKWADLVVLVKSAGWQWCDAVREMGKPIVWDALDFWEQPEANGYGEIAAREQLRMNLDIIQPALTIGATKMMASACGGAYLPHHARPGSTMQPVREKVETVAYEGTRKYLGKWAKLLQEECDRRGWKFVINPPTLSQADIVVAFRNGQWDGYMCRCWKSGVKYVNAMAVGRPVITQGTAGFHEMDADGLIVEDPMDLGKAFNWFTDKEPRQTVFDNAAKRHHEFDLNIVAMQYRKILEGVLAK